MFDQAFTDLPDHQRYSKESAGLAIAAYERTVLANQAPFQKWLRGDLTAMTDDEKSGAIIFFDRAKCVGCHTGPALNTMEFYALGMPDLSGAGTYGVDAEDNAHLGRGGFTGEVTDNFKFKVPQLYNLRDSPFYGHGGSFNSIQSVVEYKNNGVPSKSEVPVEQIAPRFQPLGLSANEIDQLVAFIENALYDDQLLRYEPPSIPSGYCFPNNDEVSKQDRRCD